MWSTYLLGTAFHSLNNVFNLYNYSLESAGELSAIWHFHIESDMRHLTNYHIFQVILEYTCIYQKKFKISHCNCLTSYFCFSFNVIAFHQIASSITTTVHLLPQPLVYITLRELKFQCCGQLYLLGVLVLVEPWREKV